MSLYSIQAIGVYGTIAMLVLASSWAESAAWSVGYLLLAAAIWPAVAYRCKHCKKCKECGRSQSQAECEESEA